MIEHRLNQILEDPLTPGKFYFWKKMKVARGSLIGMGHKIDVTDAVTRIVVNQIKQPTTTQFNDLRNDAIQDHISGALA